MSKNFVVHCKKEKYDVYIGRGNGSIWGNPFQIGIDGNREQVIQKYMDWLLTKPDLILKVSELKGKVLGCWCDPLPCHGHVLSNLANRD